MKKFRWLVALSIILSLGSGYSSRASTVTVPTANTSVTNGTGIAITNIAPPTNPTSSVSSVGVTLKWTDNSSNEQFFLIKRASSATLTWETLNKVQTNETYYIDNANLISGQNYKYQILACQSLDICSTPTYLYVFYSAPSATSPTQGTGSTAASPTVSATPVPPTPPSLLGQATTPLTNMIYLKWQDNSTDETHFFLEKRTANSLTWTQVARPGANSGTLGSYTDALSIAPATGYYYRLQACKEGSGCSAYAESPLITTPADRDTLAPSAPTNLSASLNTDGTIKLTWVASKDNVGILKYEIYKNGAFLESTPNTSFLDTSSNTSANQYYVIAFDAMQNKSQTSNLAYSPVPGTTTYTAPQTPTPITDPIITTSSTQTTNPTFPQAGTVNTIAVPTTTVTKPPVLIQPITSSTVQDQTLVKPIQDISPPTAPTNLTVTVTNLGLNLNWNPSTDDQEIYGYKVYRNDTLIYVTKETTKTDSFLVKGKIYTYYVVAVDTSGKISEASNKADGMFPVPTEPAINKQSTIKGQILDTDGNPVSNAVLHIWNSNNDFYIPSDLQGNFSFDAPEGNYKTEYILPSSRADLIKSDIGFTSLIAGEIRIFAEPIELTKNYEKNLVGSVNLPNGEPITDALVSALNRATNQWVSTSTDSTGSFKLGLSSGSWYVNIKPQDTTQNRWLPDQTEKNIIFTDNLSKETKTASFVVKPAPVKVRVKLVNDAGEPVENAGASIENVSGAATLANVNYNKSDVNGYVYFWVVPGKYIIRGFSPLSDLINPDDVNFAFSTGAEHEIVLKFKAKQAARGIVSGTVALTDGTSIDGAEVWGWSESGQQTKTQTDSNGNFFFTTLPNDTWHVSAVKVLEGFPYRSADTIIKVGGLSGKIDLKLFKPKVQLPQIAQVKEEAKNPIIVKASNGAAVYVPSNAAVSSTQSTASSTLIVTIEAKVEAPTRANTRVIGNSYDVTIADDKGKEINKFDNDLEITLPYTDEMLKESGINDSAIVPSYYDEDTGVWVRVKDFVINKQKKVVILKIKHLTIIALVAPADSTPPAPPTKLSYAVRNLGSVTLSWTNPVADFHHVKIYRTEKKNSSSWTLLNDLVTASTYKDTGLKKITYYYHLKTVDASGNESQKTLSASVNAAKVNVVVKIPSGLKLGSSGESVKLLQETLIKAGLLPSDLVVSGKFDKATQTAVKLFQKKNKLSQVGSVGPATAAALNKLIK